MKIMARAESCLVELFDENNDELFRLQYDNLEYSIDVARIADAIPALMRHFEEAVQSAD